MISGVSEQHNESPAEKQAWALLMAARVLIDEPLETAFPEGLSTTDTVGLLYSHQDRSVSRVSGEALECNLQLSARDGWHYDRQLPTETQHLLELYLPVLGTPMQPDCVIGHLGQSVDARIATSSGDAFFVTGEENRKHLHRLRSLCQAVVVGAGTILADDPQLTTRAVSGESPVRVIIDPSARVPLDIKVLNDGQASTWLLHDSTIDLSEHTVPAGCRRIAVESAGGGLQPRAILDVLARQGIRRVFVEGGGVTVSRFFNARCLHRLQVATAPLLVGEGVPALQIPGAQSMLQALRPDYRLYRMGEDVMWDFKLEDSLWEGIAHEAVTPATGNSPSLTLLWSRG